MFPQDNNTLETVTLEKFSYRARTRLSRILIDQFSNEPIIRYAIDRATDSFAIDIIQEIYGENLQYIKYPSDWLEALKERWLPKWALVHWPVRYTSYDIRAFYPKVSAPHLPHTVQLIQQAR